MSYSQNYRTLFEMKVMHAYFLNRGETELSELEEEKQMRVLNEYAFSSFLKIIPTAETQRIMANQRMLLRSDSLGFKVVASVHKEEIIIPDPDPDPEVPDKIFYRPFIDLSDDPDEEEDPDNDLVLEFLVKIGDPAFENYTDLTITKNRLFLFANYTPAGTTAVTPIPLLNGGDIDDGFRLNEASTKKLAERFTREQQVGLLGFIQLKMKGTFSSITEDTTDPVYHGLIPSDPQKYELSFLNRSTIWRYRFRGAPFYAETEEELPLTKNGYIPVDAADLVLKHSDTGLEAESSDFNLEGIYYPSPDVKSVETDPSGTYYSVIYI